MQDSAFKRTAPRPTSFLVVGGGIVGLSVARELAERRARVTLLERDLIGGAGAGIASVAAMGILIPPNDRRSAFGRLLKMACRRFDAVCRSLHDETGLDPGYRRQGGLHLHRQPPRERSRERAVESFARSGVNARWLERRQIDDLVDGIATDFVTALYLSEEASVDPPDLVAALGESCRRRGVEIRQRVGEVRLCDGERACVKLPDGQILRSDAVVVTAGAWSPAVLEGAADSLRVTPIRGQAIEIEMAMDLGSSPNIHFEAGPAAEVHHLLPKGRGRAWIGSTVEDVGFDAGTTAAGTEELSRALSELFPEIGVTRVVDSWSGLRPQAGRRGGPFLGPLPGRESVWVACGHYKSGIVLGPESARLLVKQLMGEDPDTATDAFTLAELEAFWPVAR